jgi:hypothetical protein
MQRRPPPAPQQSGAATSRCGATCVAEIGTSFDGGWRGLAEWDRNFKHRVFRAWSRGARPPRALSGAPRARLVETTTGLRPHSFQLSPRGRVLVHPRAGALPETMALSRRFVVWAFEFSKRHPSVQIGHATHMSPPAPPRNCSHTTPLPCGRLAPQTKKSPSRDDQPALHLVGHIFLSPARGATNFSAYAKPPKIPRSPHPSFARPTANPHKT